MAKTTKGNVRKVKVVTLSESEQYKAKTTHEVNAMPVGVEVKVIEKTEDGKVLTGLVLGGPKAGETIRFPAWTLV